MSIPDKVAKAGPYQFVSFNQTMGSGSRRIQTAERGLPVLGMKWGLVITGPVPQEDQVLQDYRFLPPRANRVGWSRKLRLRLRASMRLSD
jgi:hypothetical protein